MPRLRGLCGGLLALAPGGAAWWPFGDAEAEAEASRQEMSHFAFPGAPEVVVVESHFGFDPWEDLHKNMERLVQRSAGRALPAPGAAEAGAGALARPLEDELGSLFSIFGDQHAGHFGRSEGSFQVEDDHHSRFRITATLPGYKFGGDGGPGEDSPLSVRAVGRRSLVVSGTQRMGHVLSTWQRSFALPKGSDINNVSVTYSSTSGNLTVDVPRLNTTEVTDDTPELEPGDEDEDFDMMLPPALRAMQSGVPALLGQLSAGQRPRGGGFLMPMQSLPGMLDEMLGVVDQLHPRFQPPEGGDRPVPEDAVVNLVGCFAEAQLDKVELKYYGESNAASFNAMYWHASADRVPFFAMSRHEQPLGHAFTAHGFVREGETPRWGVYDGCGARCADEPERWCGCANEPGRGLGNPACSLEGEKRFAVYKIGEAPKAPGAEAEAAAGAGEAGAAGADERAAPPAQGRPYWQLTNSRNSSDAPSIEIVVPKGTVAKAHGREVILYNATDPAALAGASAEGERSPEATAPPASTESSAEAPGADLAPTAAPTATPVGRMRLPVSSEACSWDTARADGEGGQVIQCRLDQRDVKQVPIKVIDEL